ncbi:hypothetical protein HRbin08_01194 [bacterium HR08]|nr:hypothetical protein HRbin08_01194 [bacterium HR08]
MRRVIPEPDVPVRVLAEEVRLITGQSVAHRVRAPAPAIPSREAAISGDPHPPAPIHEEARIGERLPFDPHGLQARSRPPEDAFGHDGDPDRARSILGQSDDQTQMGQRSIPAKARAIEPCDSRARADPQPSLAVLQQSEDVVIAQSLPRREGPPLAAVEAAESPAGAHPEPSAPIPHDRAHDVGAEAIARAIDRERAAVELVQSTHDADPEDTLAILQERTHIGVREAVRGREDGEMTVLNLDEPLWRPRPYDAEAIGAEGDDGLTGRVSPHQPSPLVHPHSCARPHPEPMRAILGERAHALASQSFRIERDEPRARPNGEPRFRSHPEPTLRIRKEDIDARIWESVSHCIRSPSLTVIAADAARCPTPYAPLGIARQ